MPSSPHISFTHLPRPLISSLLLLVAASVAHAEVKPPPATGGALPLHLRTRVETFKGSGTWDEVVVVKSFDPRQTALVICDVWDKHWCRGATERCDALAKRMAPLVEAARAAGIRIVHAPSDTMDFYKDTPMRKRAVGAPAVKPPEPRKLSDPPLPIDDSDGGCDTPGDRMHRAWSRQHAAIRVADDDLVSDSGEQIYSYLQQQGVKNVLIMGVHTNMCVLGRSFGIRQMTRWGMNCVLLRDLTDTMYDPQDAPRVSHDRGTELVVEHIEKYWCPSITSDDLAKLSPSSGKSP